MQDQELSSPKKRRKVARRHEPTAGRPVDDITQEELDMVADSVKDKEYDSACVSLYVRFNILKSYQVSENSILSF